MTTTRQLDFATLAISDDTYAAMLTMYKDRTSCGWNLNREADMPIITALRTLRDEKNVNFIAHERGDGFIELNNFARAYIYWRQNMERGK